MFAAEAKKYNLDDLVRVAKRDNNPKRPYLYVNPIQGKHIPVKPSDALDMYHSLAAEVEARYHDERVMVIGFAETATAIGAGLAMFCECAKYCTQTTREQIDGGEYLYFTESHSHATEQSLVINDYRFILEDIDRIVFAEDEVTTGNTILKLVSRIEEEFDGIDIRFSIASVLNSMQELRLRELEERGIECLFLSRMDYEYRRDDIFKYDYSNRDNANTDNNVNADMPHITVHEITGKCDLRKVQDVLLYEQSCCNLANSAIQFIMQGDSGYSVLVLGTEEFMMPALIVANGIAAVYPDYKVRFHATTRSPILVSDDSGYPFHNRSKLESFYEAGRKTYIYNLEKYDQVIIVTDSDNYNPNAAAGLIQALKRKGNDEIIVIKWSDR